MYYFTHTRAKPVGINKHNSCQKLADEECRGLCELPTSATSQLSRVQQPIA